MDGKDKAVLSAQAMKLRFKFVVFFNLYSDHIFGMKQRFIL